MDVALNNITLLTSSYWEVQKIEIKGILMHFGAWQFIENPVAAVKSNSFKVEEVTEEKLTSRECEDLKFRKDIAYTIIYQSLSKEYKPLISSIADGAVTWTILSEHFELIKRVRIIQLDDFFSTKYVP